MRHLHSARNADTVYATRKVTKQRLLAESLGFDHNNQLPLQIGIHSVEISGVIPEQGPITVSSGGVPNV